MVSTAPTCYVHRGFHGTEYAAPENSRAALLQTVKEGFGIELDVRLTKDGKVVVHHDAQTARVFEIPKPGAKRAQWDTPIHELDYADLQAARPQFNAPPKPKLTRRIENFILRHKFHRPSEDFHAEQIPLLSDVVTMLRQEAKSTPLLVELKVLTQGDAPGLNEEEVRDLNNKLASETARVLHAEGYEDNVTLIGFDGEMLKTAKETDIALHDDATAKLQTGYISFPALLQARKDGPVTLEGAPNTMRNQIEEGLLCRKKPYKAEKLANMLQQWRDTWKLDAILPSYGEINEQFMQAARELGLKVIPGRCWERPKTELAEAGRLRKLGVDGLVITHGARAIKAGFERQA